MQDHEILNWDKLSDNELKNVLKDLILGRGMAGSTQYLHFKNDYHDHISGELRNRVNRILIKMIDEVDPIDVTVGGRAIHICGEIRDPGMLEKIGSISNSIDSYLDFIEAAKSLESCIGYFGYIAEFNRAAGKFRLSSAKPVLLRQAAFCDQSRPKPISKEHYQYYMCGKSAIAALEPISLVT